MTEDFDEAIRHLPRYELSEAEQERHLRMLAALPQGRARNRRRRRIAILTCAVVGIGGIGVGTAAAFGVFSAAPADRNIGHCYATADLKDPHNHDDFMIALPPGETQTTLNDAASQAMDICTGAWQQGMLSTTDPKIGDPQPPPWNRPVPPLIVCVLPSGQVGVFPGDKTTCAQLGLPVADLTG